MTERQIARVQPQEVALTWPQVSEITGYEMPDLALIRHKMAGSLGVQSVDQVPLYDVAIFVKACANLRLDPLVNQAHWIRRGGKGVLQVGIDGYRAVAEDSGAYAGSSEPVFRGQIECAWVDKRGQRQTRIVPEYCQVTVWKIVAGYKGAFTGEARWDEFYPGDIEGFQWRKMPRHMLAKCAEAQALRKAFARLKDAEFTAVDDVAGEPPLVAEPTVQVQRVATERPHLTHAEAVARYDQIFKDPEPEPEPEPEEDPEEEPAPVAEQEQDPRAALWTVNRELSAQAAALGLRVRALNTKASSEDVAQNNAELGRLINAHGADPVAR